MDAKINAVLVQMRGVPPPPGYAKALSRQYQEMRSFLREFNSEDSEMGKRLLRRSSDIQYVVEDMKKAHKEASNSKKFPIVMIPSGIWADILGKPHEKPEDGEHWPQDRRDGPMTWKA